MLLACGGGSGGSSGVAADKAVPTLTQAEKSSICEAQYDYFFGNTVTSAEGWCLWQAQSNATGTTDAEIQSTCAVKYDTCMIDAQATFDRDKASVPTLCEGTEPLNQTLVSRYRSCNTTVGQLEQCGRDQFDIYGAIRDVPCSQYTAARRAAVNTDSGADSCEAIDPTCPPPT